MELVSAGHIRPGPQPQVVSMGATLTSDGGNYTLHSHVHDELCLISDDATVIIHGGRERTARPGTLYLFRRGEAHGYRNRPGQRPRLWVCHYQQDAESYQGMPWLDDSDPGHREWQLDRTQQMGYRTLFLKLQDEHYHPRPGSATAESAWLRLLITFAGRLGQTGDAPLPSPRPLDAELQDVLAILTAHLADPSPLEQAISNYDSVRHRFAKAFGHGPREHLAQLRLRTACNLLLETSLPIKAIAAAVGYARQHEFARAFARSMGRSPSAWRAEPS